jgi:ATP-dependent Clp protease ATP-binding subunit ClpX
MFDLPDLDDVSEVVIDADVVAGKKEPVRVVANDDVKAKKDEAA